MADTREPVDSGDATHANVQQDQLRRRLERDLAVQGSEAPAPPTSNEDSTQDGHPDRRPDPAGTPTERSND